MKKLFTTCVLALFCLISLRTNAQTSLLLDYNGMDEVYTANNGSWDYHSFVWQLNKNYPHDTLLSLRFASVLYDSLINFNYNTGAAATIPLTNATVRLDSFQLYYFHSRSEISSTDVIFLSVYDASQYTISGTGVNQTFSAPWIWRDSILISGSNSANSLGTIINGMYSLTKKPNITLPTGHSFGIYVEFRGDLANYLYVLAGYRDECNGGCAAELAYNTDNSLYYLNSGNSSGITGLYRDCDGSNGLTPGACEHFEVQNFALPAYVTVTGATSNLPPTMVTTAATNITQTTATLHGTANANNATTTVTFEYGLTTSYGSTANGSPSSATGNTNTNISAAISGLTAGTTYHYRIKGVNAGGTVYGSDMTFTTQSVPVACTPDGSVTSGMSPTSVNIPCITKNQSFSQVFTFVIPSTITFGPITVTITSFTIDSIGNLPAGLTAGFTVVPATYPGGTTGCFTISGTTNAPCGQYKMPLYATMTGTSPAGPYNSSGDMSTTAGAGFTGFETRFLRVIASGDPCPSVNTSQSSAFTAYGTCGGGSTFPPTVVTTGAGAVLQTTAQLNGTVNANGFTSTVSFDYGLTAAYGTSVAASPASVAGTTVTSVTKALTGLTPSTTYHFRVVATSVHGTSYGLDQTFTTLAPPGSCTPAGGVTAGMSPTSSNVSCITKGQAFSQVFTFAVPTEIHNGSTFPVNSFHFDSVGNLPAGLTASFNQNPATYNGGTTGCFEITGTTNASCGQYQMPVYVTINTIFSQSGELSALAASDGLPGFELRFLRVIGSGDPCPAVNPSQGTAYAAYGVCSSGSISANITNQTNVNCFGQSTGSATVTPSGGSNYTYAWSNGGGSAATASNLAAGTYTVTVTSSNQTVTATVTITQPSAALTVGTSSTQASCGQNDGTATATPTGGTSPYTYLWSTNGTGSSISNAAAGNYSVVVTDNKGCSASATVTVGSPANFTLSLTTSNVNCYGASTGSVTAVTTGGNNLTYVWNVSGSTSIINNLPAGPYTVTVTDGSGCSKTASTTVTQPANPLTVTTSSTPSSCGSSTGSATATVTNNNGTPLYNWSPGGSTSPTINGLAAGVYSVTVTAGGCTATASAIVNNSNGPNITIQKTDPSCFGGANGTAMALVSGGSTPYSYTWSNNATGSSVNGLNAGTYSVVVTDNSGCSAFGNVTLNQPNPLTLTENITNVSCFGSSTGSISVTTAGGTSPYAYSWSSGSSSSSTANQAAGSYTISVTDSKSCTVVSTYTITQPALLAVVATSTPSSGSNGTATANPSGGTSPYNYSWNTSPTQNSATATALAPGAYSVTVSDSKGCSATAGVSIGTVGINDVPGAFISCLVFPNPATNNIYVVLEGNGFAAVTIKITDITGKVVYTSTDIMNPTMKSTIDATGFTSGIYVVEITGKSGTIRRRVTITR